jgi:hypothetical protein
MLVVWASTVALTAIPSRSHRNKDKQDVVVQWLTLLLVFGRFLVQISNRRPATLTEVFSGFLQSLKANAGIVP